MKKFAGLMGAIAMLLVVTAPAAAFWWMGSDEATVKNYAWVKTDAKAKTNTGFNTVTGGMVGGGSVLTGAGFAGNSLTTQVNTNTVGCNCYDDLYLKNKAGVRNEVSAKTNTGFNTVSGGFVMGGFVGTGAGDAQNLVTTVVNTNVVGD